MRASPEGRFEEMAKSGRLSVVSLDEVRAVFETNVFGVIAVTQAMLPLLRRSGLVRRSMKHDADYVFYVFTRSICPNCRKVIDAKVLLRHNKVYMRKRCPDCGPSVSQDVT